MILVDTGFLIAFCQPRDALHKRANAWCDAISERLLVTDYVLWEMFNFLSNPADRPRAHLTIQYVQMADNWKRIGASNDLFEAGLQLHAEREDKSWSLTDCISFVVMERHDIRQALTVDRHSSRQALKPCSAGIRPDDSLRFGP